MTNSFVLDLTRLTLEQSICFNAVARNIRLPYNELIAEVANAYPDDLAWQFSSLMSRNSIFETSFMRCCQLGLVAEYLQESESISSIITDSRAMAKVISQYVNLRNIDVVVIHRTSLCVKLKVMLRPWKRILSLIAHNLALIYAAWVTKPDSQEDLNLPIKILDLFILQNSFENGGVYQDRYYPGMFEQLTEAERKQCFYLPTLVGVKLFSYKNHFKKIRDLKNRFLVREDYLKSSDYIEAFTSMWRLPRLVRKLNANKYLFLSFDIKHLLCEEISQTFSNGSSFLATLNYRFAKRLHEKKVPVDLLVDWNENQVHDKGLIKGFHEFFTSTPVIGYQGFIVDPTFHIYLHPTQDEINRGFIPDALFVVGEGLMERTKEFAPNLEVASAPAFRFSGIWVDRQKINNSKIRRIVLVALPIHSGVAREMLEFLVQANQNSMIKSVHFLIKAHPSHDPALIEKLFPYNWPDNFEITAGDFNNVLDSAQVLIGSYSTTPVEALARGIPVIIIGGQSGFTHNPIPEAINPDIWSLCYEPADLTNSLEKLLNRTSEQISQHVQLGHLIRQHYFQKIDRPGVCRLLRYPYEKI